MGGGEGGEGVGSRRGSRAGGSCKWVRGGIFFVMVFVCEFLSDVIFHFRLIERRSIARRGLLKLGTYPRTWRPAQSIRRVTLYTLQAQAPAHPPPFLAHGVHAVFFRFYGFREDVG